MVDIVASIQDDLVVDNDWRDRVARVRFGQRQFDFPKLFACDVQANQTVGPKVGNNALPVRCGRTAGWTE